MTILAIDPGPTNSAWVLWDGTTIVERGLSPNAEVLHAVGGFAESRHVDQLAIEMIASYGMTVGKEVFETCVWIGRFMQAWKSSPARADADVKRVPRLQIKVHHCHNSRANDSNIRQALIDRLGAPGTKKNPGPTYGISKDLWAALAVALYVEDRSRAEAA